MPCAAGELCHIPDRTPESQNAHECRGGCGGRLHGLCGEVQEQVSDNLIHRICPSCLERDRKAFTVAATTAAACSSSSGTKRKIGTTGHSEDVNVKKSKPHTPGGASGKSRVRLSHGQKMDVLGLLKERVSHAQIAHRFGCGERTVSNIAQQRKKLEEEDKLAGCDQSAKSRRRGYFPKVALIDIRYNVRICMWCTCSYLSRLCKFCRLKKPVSTMQYYSENNGYDEILEGREWLHHAI